MKNASMLAREKVTEAEASMRRTLSSAPPRASALLITLSLIVAIVAVAAALRWHGLDTKTFWGDETYTALRMSGHTQLQLDRLADGKSHPIEVLRRFQRLDPTAPLAATSNSLAVDEPQHPPLFFVMERIWAILFGNSPAALRSLSAVTGMLALPAMFWLCVELFGTKLFAWIGTSLIAVSPFFVTYAHEAREYAAWGTVTLLATAAFLAAVQRGPKWWSVYTVLIAAGLYLDLLFVWVMLSHAVILVASTSRQRRDSIGFACATFAAMLAFVPWIITFIQHRQVIAYGLSWGSAPMAPAMYVAKIAFAASTSFFDLTFESLSWAPLAALVCALIVVALVTVARNASPITRTTILALTFTSFIAFIAEDALTHSYYATGARYQVPTWIGTELAVTYLIVHLSIRQPFAAGVILTTVLMLGFACCVKADVTSIWWDNHDDFEVPAFANALDRTRRPLIVSEHSRLPKLLVMSHLVDPDSTFDLMPLTPLRFFTLPVVGGPVFLLEPSKELLAQVAAAGCQVTPVKINFSPETAADRFHSELSNQQGRQAPALWRFKAGEPCAKK